MCGVRFMAETCKVLSPDKTVYLANPLAGCPMAEQLDVEMLEMLKAKYPGYAVVAYINTTSELKTACDVCVTSSSAVKICRALDADKILFIPDPNLGHYVAQQMPEKEFAFYSGRLSPSLRHEQAGCGAGKGRPSQRPVPGPPGVPSGGLAEADYIGSTTGIMAYAKQSDAKEFIIGTENSIVEHLQFDCPEKRFYRCPST